MTITQELTRKQDAAHICRLLCRTQSSVGNGCHCDGETTSCRAVPLYARHAAAVLSYLEKVGRLTYGGTP